METQIEKRRKASLKWYRENKKRVHEYGRKWRKENPEKCVRYALKWQKENPEKVKETARKHYKKNPEKKKQSNLKWQKENPEKVKEAARKHYKKNSDKILERNRKWRKENPEKLFNITKKWNEKNSIKLREYYRKRIMEKRKTDPMFKLNRNISRNITRSLKGNKNGKSWLKLVPYTLDDLIKHLKKTLPKGYTWDDYLKKNILHLDHIIPISVHNFESYTDTDFQRCWALKNLQLLPAKENLTKSAKLEKHFQPSLLF